MLEAKIRDRLRGDRGYRAIRAINGIGPNMAAILVANVQLVVVASGPFSRAFSRQGGGASRLRNAPP